ncbi:MAG: hypothetical protein K2X86_01665 [Cytophagaceae bacterium]|nr:hypothetical protein [Cytophagaceae bacterium]
MEEQAINEYKVFSQFLDTEFSMLESKIKQALKISDKGDSDTDYILRHSFFISVYSFTEYALKRFCEMVADNTPYKRRVGGFEKMHQHYSFLVNEMKFDQAKSEKEWEMLNVYRDIRNSIVHYNSTIGKNISSASYRFITSSEHIQFEEPHTFRLKDDALIMVLIQVSKRFLNGLMDEYDLKN